MNKKFIPFVLSLSLALILASCSFNAGGNQLIGGGARPTATVTVVKPSATPRPTPTPRPTATTAPTEVPFTDAIAAAQTYGGALVKGDFAAAADQLSSYGLMIASLTTGEVTCTSTVLGVACFASRVLNAPILAASPAAFHWAVSSPVVRLAIINP